MVQILEYVEEDYELGLDQKQSLVLEEDYSYYIEWKDLIDLGMMIGGPELQILGAQDLQLEWSMNESQVIISALLVNYYWEMGRDSSIRNNDIMVVHPDVCCQSGIVLDTPIEQMVVVHLGLNFQLLAKEQADWLVL